MTKAEKWLIAKAVNRYLNEIKKQDIFKKRLLPLIHDFCGKKTKVILQDIRSLLLDWMDELDEFLVNL